MGIASVTNKKAYHDYYVLETLECGISLLGNEVKSIRAGKFSFKESWCKIENNTLILKSMHITKWDTSNLFDVNESRDRVLLAHKKEIKELESKIVQQGYTLVPLKIYFVNGKCKVLVGLCKGKHNYDKRDLLKQKQIKMDISRELRGKL